MSLLSSTLVLLLAFQAHSGLAAVARGTSMDTRACDSSQPAIKDANTVTVKLYSDDSCCNVLQTTSMGVLDECHNAAGSFYSLRQAVGQNMFGRNIHIASYTGTDCAGDASIEQLTNTAECWLDGLGSSAALKSFKITVIS